MSTCVVFLSNAPYFDKFLETCSQLIQNGKYTQDICLIIDKKLHDVNIYNHDFLLENNIIVKYFPEIEFSENFHRVARQRERYDKLFQYQKFYLFDMFFKKWNYIFYIDSGMKICSSIQPFLDILKSGCFYAHSDSYHKYEWNLDRQFIDIEDYSEKLRNTMDTNIDYFQTGILIFDTKKYINENIFNNLIKTAEAFPNCFTNEQGTMNICFVDEWEQVPFYVPNRPYLRLYDSMPRFKHCKYIIYKWDFGVSSIENDPLITGKLSSDARVIPHAKNFL